FYRAEVPQAETTIAVGDLPSGFLSDIGRTEQNLRADAKPLPKVLPHRRADDKNEPGALQVPCQKPFNVRRIMPTVAVPAHQVIVHHPGDVVEGAHLRQSFGRIERGYPLWDDQTPQHLLRSEVGGDPRGRPSPVSPMGDAPLGDMVGGGTPDDLAARLRLGPEGQV